MTEMEERVARALCEDFGLPADGLHWIVPPAATDPSTFRSVANWTRFMPQARVALAAARLPTREMLEAAEAAGSPESPALPHEVWPAMIDAAIGKVP